MEPVDADRDELAVDKLDVVGKGDMPVENEDLFGISIIFIIRGSQWGGVFYGYRLKFWLFYGYRLIFSVTVNKKVKN